MPTYMKHYDSIDEYIKDQPESTQVILQKLRQTIQSAAPEATEAISYGIPTFKFHGNLVHFGGYLTHIGFYPASSGMNVFKKELAKYATGKGTARFPLDEPLPFDLITKIVKFRVEENTNKKKSKQ